MGSFFMFCSTTHYSTGTYSASKNGKVSHRAREKGLYAVMRKAVRYRYTDVSKEAKHLYEVILDDDHADKKTGICKGYSTTAPKTLAIKCNREVTSIYRYLRELRKAKLIKTIARQYKTSIIIILDIPEKILSTFRNERRLAKKQNVINDISKNNSLNHKQIHYSTRKIERYMAQCAAVVTHLISLGYTPEQAVNDFLEFGRDELQQQIDNLYAYERCGKHFYSEAKWLNWAIRDHHRIKAEVQKEATEALELACTKPVRYVQVVDEETQTVQLVAIDESQFSQRSSDDVEQLKAADVDRAREVVPRDEIRESHTTTPQAIPQDLWIDNRIGTSRFWRPNRAASPFARALQFPDYSRNLVTMWYGCGQENGSALLGRYLTIQAITTDT